MSQVVIRKSFRSGWQAYFILLLAVGALGAIMMLPPIAQDPAYHAYADGRAFFGVPYFFNVVTNLAFLAVGLAGIWLCAQGHAAMTARLSWTTCFVGVALVSVGSGSYHLAPDNGTLVWDRVPMSVGFMGLFVAVLSDHVGPRLERLLLVPAVLLGIASVVYWQYADDLRPYVWVQFVPLLTIPVLLMLVPGRHTHRGYLLAALAIYLVAKTAEHYDRAVFALTGELISGHSLKHLLAALALYVVYLMLKRRARRFSLL